MKYKFSKYLYITNDEIQENDAELKILYSLITGAIVKMEKGLVNDINRNNFERVSNEYIDVLLENRILVDWDLDEYEYILAENIQFNNNNFQKLGLTLQPTSYCQLDCTYCGQVHKKHNMNENIQDQLKKYIFDKLQSNSEYKDLLVTWYGGEPLLSIANIRKLSFKFIKYCSEKEISYSAKIITNGVNLKKEIYEELVNLNVKDFQITLDGLKEIHDTRRFLKDRHKGSFDIIYSNILKITNSDSYDPRKGLIKIRINVDSNNSESLYGLLDRFVSDGIHNKIFVYFSPVYDWGDVEGSQKSLSKEEYANLEIDLLIYMYHNGFNIHLESLLPKRNPTVCMAVDKNQEVLDADGNIYPCWEFPYTPKYETKNYKIGNIISNSRENINAKTRGWNIDRELENYWCKDCSFLPACGGGCPKQWYDDQPPCPSFKLNIEERLFLYYLEKKEVLCH